MNTSSRKVSISNLSNFPRTIAPSKRANSTCPILSMACLTCQRLLDLFLQQLDLLALLLVFLLVIFLQQLDLLTLLFIILPQFHVVLLLSIRWTSLATSSLRSGPFCSLWVCRRNWMSSWLIVSWRWFAARSKADWEAAIGTDDGRGLCLVLICEVRIKSKYEFCVCAESSTLFERHVLPTGPLYLMASVVGRSIVGKVEKVRKFSMRSSEIRTPKSRKLAHIKSVARNSRACMSVWRIHLKLSILYNHPITRLRPLQYTFFAAEYSVRLEPPASMIASKLPPGGAALQRAASYTSYAWVEDHKEKRYILWQRSNQSHK